MSLHTAGISIYFLVRCIGAPGWRHFPARPDRCLPIDWNSNEYRVGVTNLHKRVISGESARMEFEMLGRKGTRRWLEAHSVPMQEENRTVHLAITRDISDRKRMEAQVRRSAFHDPLTNLPNRRLFMDRLRQSMVASNRSLRYCVVLFLDLDNFKALNDAHGHATGDQLL
jgi:predicted signal transduction protein with EAL and GGDEF domain